MITTVLLSLVSSPVQAAAYDALQVGGAHGTPASTSPIAAWWNPANLAAEGGTRFLVELAPTLSTTRFTPTGSDEAQVYNSVAPAPTLAVSSDFGVEGLAVGGAFYIPYIQGGVMDPQTSGSGRYHRSQARAVEDFVTLSAAYEFADRVSFGASGSLIVHQYTYGFHVDDMPLLAQEMEAQGDDSPYDDSMLGDPAYDARVDLADLKGTSFGFGLGTRVQLTPKIAAAASFNWSPSAQATGDATVSHDCPPETDAQGRGTAQALGLCDSSYTTDATVSYDLPHRVNLGVEINPNEKLRVEVMGAWLGWGRQDEVAVELENTEQRNVLDNPETGAVVDRSLVFARDHRNTFWAGVDVQYGLGERWTVGGRLIHDHSAVPEQTVSVASLDIDGALLGASAAFQATRSLEVGLSASQGFGRSRDDTRSSFASTLDKGNVPARFDHADSSGTYELTSTRVGLSLAGNFGG